ncbi:ABC transporter ATP-binding protein [Micromonospora craniellae]|uniref:ABC transporter ATP-binding protein n=1 Tax=Micromonospora craniellae TaxID=2294034 RepID=A0A372G3N2_9ACTN|nr:ABC transporter ATP-binding protein [Micromonospora craniellae]QOC92833.1 ABC transporter ATP-binding protein [Micromonospora craniellae]RFS47613.1 ABC transporter ATP-binding protein [Micromonospora craniellae]
MIRQLRRVLGPEHQREYTRFLVWASVYGVLQGFAVSLLVPIARSLADGDWAATWRWIGVLAIAVIGCGIAHYVQAMRAFGVALVVLRTMHLNIGDHLVTLPIGWFAGKTGSVAQVASKGTMAAGSAAAHLMTPVVIGMAAPASVTVSMFFFDWRIGVALLVAAPLIALAARIASSFIAKSEHATHRAAAESSERVIEFARCQPVLRAFGRTSDTGYAPLRDAIKVQQTVARRTMVESVLGLALNGLAVQLVFTGLVVLAAVLALGGELSGIDLLALLGVATRFVQPLMEIGEYGGALRQVRGELTRIQGIMDTRPLPEPSQAAAVSAAGTVEFDHVDFGYVPGTPLLKDLSLTVPPRTMTALVGPSGSGKTTIIRLIARFYDVDAGTVRVGGVDVRDQTAEDHMAQLALVFQDVYLFDDTLRENIRLGRPDATEAEIDEAAHLAGVTEIADRLPAGWNTRVGEAGSALSGGERQRVSVARAILKRAPIVLLDEATAALDPENERYLQRSLETLREHATLIVIAHRLSTVVNADQIIVLNDHGRIAERGSHDDLLAQGGRYAAFWHERSSIRGWRLAAGATPHTGSS